MEGGGGFVPTVLYSLRPNSHRTHDAMRSKWDLLSSMGVFTLHTSKIKGKTFQFACASRRVSCVN